MKKISLYIALILTFMSCILFSPHVPSAKFYTVNDIIDDMREYEKMAKGLSYATGPLNSFMGYILGVADALETSGASFYIPQGTSTRQIVDVVTKYINNHPEQWHLSADVVVSSAIKEMWPKK